MHRYSPAVILGWALLAGVLAGLLVALFHLFVTEPLLQRAIDLEAAHRQAAGQPPAYELFTRPEQRAGLFLGYLLYGVGWGLLFGVICSLVLMWTNQSREPRSAWKQLLWLVVICYWTVGLFPQLKYPANPPGVGSPATITYRQELYLGCLVLSVLGSVLVLGLYHRLGQMGQKWQILKNMRLPFVLVVFFLYVGAIWLFMPPYPDPITLPPNLVMSFRWLSVGGTALFWFALGGIFLLLWQREWSFSSKRTPQERNQTSVE
jgi:predicted cobalt transporter CbtA